MQKPVTERVLALVLKRLGDAEFNPVSKRALARCLGSSDVQVGRVMDGETRMDRAMFVRALKYLELAPDDYLQFSAEFDAEVTAKDDYMEAIFVRLREIRAGEVKAKFFGEGVSPRARKPRTAASILLATCAAFGGLHDARASENAALARTALAPATSPSLYIMLRRRWGRLLDRLRGLLTPPPLLAPAYA